MIKQDMSASMNNRMTAFWRDPCFQRDQRARIVRFEVAAAAEQPGRRLVDIGVEIAANGDTRGWIGVEQGFDKQPGLQRLSIAFHRGDELSLHTRSAGADAARRYDRRRPRRAKMKIDDMQ